MRRAPGLRSRVQRSPTRGGWPLRPFGGCLSGLAHRLLLRVLPGVPARGVVPWPSPTPVNIGADPGPEEGKRRDGREPSGASHGRDAAARPASRLPGPLFTPAMRRYGPSCREAIPPVPGRGRSQRRPAALRLRDDRSSMSRLDPAPQSPEPGETAKGFGPHLDHVARSGSEVQLRGCGNQHEKRPI
jgi:hypothetical protein